MCFSTTASFTAGTVLTVIGIASITKTKNVSHLMFACIPLIFAVQQFSEGFVWLALLNNANYMTQQLAINLFLAFAIVVWPIWVSLAVLFIEENRRRRILLRICSAIGLLISALGLYYLFVYHSSAHIARLHIYYDLHIPNGDKIFLGFLYLIPTVLSLFISGVKRVPIMGSLVLISYVITRFFFKDTLLSVWCFFSAGISLMIYYILLKANSAIITQSEKSIAR
jgi:hypothetical protein